MKKYLLFFFITLFCNLALGQDREAKLLLKDSTEVEGFGEIRKNKIYFKLTLDEQPEEWTEDDAKGLEFIGHRSPEKYVYIVHGKKNEALLMEVIQQGPVELYQDAYYTAEYTTLVTPINVKTRKIGDLDPYSTTATTVKVIEYYIKKPNDAKATKVTMDFKKIGQIFFSDCEDLMANINEEEFFEEEEIIDLVKFYNRNCAQ